MELIADRVAHGESVLPARMQKRHRNRHGKAPKNLDTTSNLASPVDNCSVMSDVSEAELEELPTTEKKSKIDWDWRKLREKSVIQTMFHKDKNTVHLLLIELNLNMLMEHPRHPLATQEKFNEISIAVSSSS